MPWASSQEEEGPSLASWEGPPCGAPAAHQAEEDPGDGGGGVSAPAGGGAETGIGGIFRLFCQSGSEPVLPSIPFVFLPLQCVLLTDGESWMRNVTAVTIKLGHIALCRLLATPFSAAGNDLPGFFQP